jgi:hypothetical protein
MKMVSGGFINNLQHVNNGLQDSLEIERASLFPESRAFLFLSVYRI